MWPIVRVTAKRKGMRKSDLGARNIARAKLWGEERIILLARASEGGPEGELTEGSESARERSRKIFVQKAQKSTGWSVKEASL